MLLILFVFVFVVFVCDEGYFMWLFGEWFVCVELLVVVIVVWLKVMCVELVVLLVDDFFFELGGMCEMCEWLFELLVVWLGVDNVLCVVFVVDYWFEVVNCWLLFDV